jgi:hypothetical protein
MTTSIHLRLALSLLTFGRVRKLLERRNVVESIDRHSPYRGYLMTQITRIAGSAEGSLHIPRALSYGDYRYG